jgi:hypothetical protein
MSAAPRDVALLVIGAQAGCGGMASASRQSTLLTDPPNGGQVNG